MRSKLTKYIQIAHNGVKFKKGAVFRSRNVKSAGFKINLLGHAIDYPIFFYV